MPNRILKESICTSENLDRISSFCETVFYRLIVNCDDYGRIDARPKLLASKLFPLKDIRAKQIEDALRELTSAELVSTYVVDGKPFLQMNTWDRHQNIRAKKSKYPGPEQANGSLNTSANNCAQMNSDDCKCSRNPIQSESISESESISNNPLTPNGGTDDDAESLFGYNQFLLDAVKDWLSYKKERRQQYKPTGLKNLLGAIQKNVSEYGEEAVIEVIRESMGANYQGIVWDKLKSKSRQKPSGGYSFMDILKQEEKNESYRNS